MNDPESVLDAQVSALEEVVEASREGRCRDLFEDARRNAGETVKRAHRENRARMRAAIEEQRKRMDETLAATRARIATRERQRRQQADNERLRMAWSRLEQVLLERWQDANHRSRWIQALLEAALVRLPGDPWRIEHPAGFDPAELSSMIAQISGRCGGEAPTFASHENIHAGLRILAGGARVDGTVGGLLTDRGRVEAELLALLREDRQRRRTT